MSPATEKLTRLVDAEDRFDHSHAELRETQIEALNERFQERKDRIKLLGHRAREAGITEVRSREDMVPLLFPHTAYKSYPESFLIEEKWDRLGKWLDTVSPYPISPIETSDIADIDDWIERLAAKGHFVSCSSGTTGKSAMLLASRQGHGLVDASTRSRLLLGLGREAGRDRRIVGLAPIAAVPKNMVIGRGAARRPSVIPARERFRLPIPPITVGSLTQMVVLRKKIADGTALPEELADFEQTSQGASGDARRRRWSRGAEALVEYRDEKLHISGLWARCTRWPRSCATWATAPRTFIRTTASTSAAASSARSCRRTTRSSSTRPSTSRPDRNFQNYCMQELQLRHAQVPRGRPLSRAAVDGAADPRRSRATPCCRTRRGEIEGRAAFFDLSLDGRWGGVISGDKISIDFSPCACGSKGPSIRDNIVRYADLEGDDKIGCAGTVDAYVRGVA